jgi:hypothetical protein
MRERFGKIVEVFRTSDTDFGYSVTWSPEACQGIPRDKMPPAFPEREQADLNRVLDALIAQSIELDEAVLIDRLERVIVAFLEGYTTGASVEMLALLEEQRNVSVYAPSYLNMRREAARRRLLGHDNVSVGERLTGIPAEAEWVCDDE